MPIKPSTVLVHNMLKVAVTIVCGCAAPSITKDTERAKAVGGKSHKIYGHLMIRATLRIGTATININMMIYADSTSKRVFLNTIDRKIPKPI